MNIGLIFTSLWQSFIGNWGMTTTSPLSMRSRREPTPAAVSDALTLFQPTAITTTDVLTTIFALSSYLFHVVSNLLVEVSG